MSDEEAAKLLTIAREKIREVGWKNYSRKHNPPDSMCVLEAIEYAVAPFTGQEKLPKYMRLSEIFRAANNLSTPVIVWNDDKESKKTKRDIIRAFNNAIDYAKR